ncbi:hypothetical protein EXIGLDRAFT_735180, partial [Exidia glandulosa HHB12029]
MLHATRPTVDFPRPPVGVSGLGSLLPNRDRHSFVCGKPRGTSVAGGIGIAALVVLARLVLDEERKVKTFTSKWNGHYDLYFLLCRSCTPYSGRGLHGTVPSMIRCKPKSKCAVIIQTTLTLLECILCIRSPNSERSSEPFLFQSIEHPLRSDLLGQRLASRMPDDELDGKSVSSVWVDAADGQSHVPVGLVRRTSPAFAPLDLVMNLTEDVVQVLYCSWIMTCSTRRRAHRASVYDGIGGGAVQGSETRFPSRFIRSPVPHVFSIASRDRKTSVAAFWSNELKTNDRTHFVCPAVSPGKRYCFYATQYRI